MTKDDGFKALREKRLRYVEAARDNEFEEGLRTLLGDLYPDNAHFIYELLQNAEDARATVVEFELAEELLTVSHNGTRMFSLADIESITGIGKSTKKDDPTQIGKFGVGFKAVYSYTTRPEIRSGDFSFAIVDLFVPERVDGQARDGWTTFTFPFDRPEKSANSACTEVERGLRELGEQTLLFLNSIRAITYTLPTGDVGIVERTDQSDQTIKIVATQGEDFVESQWLRLVGPASVDDERPNPLTVAAAFKIETGNPPKSSRRADDGNAERTFSVVPLERGEVSIYFPAAKETSGLKFHIHAPFASTVARDSVRDDPGNDQLVEDIGALVVANLPTLRDMGVLDDSFLATLPNEDDPLAHPYTAIRQALVDAFNEEDVTPVRGSGFGPARALVSSPGEFRRLLRESDLTVLLELSGIAAERKPRWIRDRDGRTGRFLAGLDTIDYGWPALAKALKAVQERQDYAWIDGKFVIPSGPQEGVLRRWGAWLDSKSDPEVLDVYQLVGLGRSQRRLGTAIEVDTIPMIRLRRRGRAEHVKGRGVFLPASRSDNVQSRVPVELAYFEDDDDERANNLRAFYRAAGVDRWNERAKLETRLRAYTGGARSLPDSEADISQHLDDVQAFARFALSNRAVAREIFKRAEFLLSPHPDGSLFWVCPEDTYLDLPFSATGFGSLYEWTKEQWGEDDEVWWGQPEKYPVAGFYLDVDGINEFLDLVGSATHIEITEADVFSNPQLERAWWVNNRHSAYTEMRDWEIENLAEIVEVGDPMLLETLWNTVVEAKAAKGAAVYQANRSARRYVFESQLAQKLKSTAWVLDREGQLRFPRELSFDELRHDWKKPPEGSLALKLNFGADVTQAEQREAQKTLLAQKLGIDREDVELLKEAKSVGLSADDFRELIAWKRSKSAFPEGASEDSNRRSAYASSDALAASEHQAETRERSVVIGQAQASEESKTYLREQYTNGNGDMYCQACHGILPFKVKGEWYFEAIQFVSGRKRVHRTNALALCPLCAALYRHKRETKNDTLIEALIALTLQGGQGAVEVPVLINERVEELRFTGMHAIDLQAALKSAGEERS